MKKLLILLLIVVGFAQIDNSSKIKFNPETGELIIPDTITINKNLKKITSPNKIIHTIDPIVLKKDSLYNFMKKNPKVAGYLSFFLNILGAGHFYASGGDFKVWLRSIPYSASTLFFQSKMIANSKKEDYDSSDPSGFLQFVSYVGLIYDSMYMAKQYNIKLHNQIYDEHINTLSELKQFEQKLSIRNISKP